MQLKQSKDTWLREAGRILGERASPLIASDDISNPIRVLSMDPRIVLVRGFMSAAEIDHVLTAATGRFERSVVTIQGGVSDLRTSTTAPLKKREDPVIAELESRISDTVCFPAAHLEPLLVVRYQPGQFFKMHLDYFSEDDPDSASCLVEGGQRLFSVVLFLNNLREEEPGGATHFPHINLRVVPEAGAALFWRNQDSHGKNDKRTEHLGEIVGFSEKWIVTTWVRERPFIGD